MHGTNSATLQADKFREARDSLNRSSEMKFNFNDELAEAQEDDQVLRLKTENEVLKERLKVLES